MAGVFSILKGCQGVEEQAIARALHFLQAGNDNGNGNLGGGVSTAELKEDREEWQAHRDASMVVLVRNAMSTSMPALPQSGEGVVGAALGGGIGAGGRGGVGEGRRRRRSGGGKDSSSAYRSRRLQVRR